MMMQMTQIIRNDIENIVKEMTPKLQSFCDQSQGLFLLKTLGYRNFKFLICFQEERL